MNSLPLLFIPSSCLKDCVKVLKPNWLSLYHLKMKIKIVLMFVILLAGLLDACPLPPPRICRQVFACIPTTEKIARQQCCQPEGSRPPGECQVSKDTGSDRYVAARVALIRWCFWTLDSPTPEPHSDYAELFKCLGSFVVWNCRIMWLYAYCASSHPACQRQLLRTLS